MAYETRLLFSESNLNIANNTSVVTVTFQFRRTDYSHYSYNYTGTAYWNISCAGQSSGNVYFSLNYNVGQNVWQTVASRAFTVGHNSNGTLSVAASGYIYFGSGVSPGSLSAKASFICSTIPRYTSVTNWKNTSVTQTSAEFSWAASDTVKALNISVNNGSWTTKWTGSARSGTFTQTGLSPNTSYKIKIQVQRSDSSLWTTSSEISFTTNPIASISNASIDIDIGNNLILAFNNYTNNASYLKLEVLDEAGTYVQIASVTSVQTASYTWNLSSIADQLYQKCPTRNQMPYRIICGVSLGGIDYTNIKTGIMKVTNSNPTFSAYDYGNTVTAIKNLLGAVYMPENYGNMQVIITVENKAVPKNSASISKYVCDITSVNFNKKVEKPFSSSTAVNIDLGAFGTAGTYTLNVYAVDSRGNNSGKISKSFYILPYHKPFISTITLKRMNDYEAQTSVLFTGFYSRLSISNIEKNKNLTLKYRYCEAGKSFPATYTSIAPTFTDSGNDKQAVYNNSTFLTLDSSKSYNVEFLVGDDLFSESTVVAVSTGIAPMYVFEGGLTTIDAVPNFSNTSAKLQVGGDMSAKDVYGNIRNVFETLNSFISCNKSEPANQITGGLWFKEE
ncbi:MAG: hypothetical protein HFG95_04030 [Dorea sp.]|nr:hypothetical protein [Dorea sp.]